MTGSPVIYGTDEDDVGVLFKRHVYWHDGYIDHVSELKDVELWPLGRERSRRQQQRLDRARDHASAALAYDRKAAARRRR